MSERYLFYVVTNGSPLDEAVREWRSEANLARQRQFDFAVKVGGIGVAVNSRVIGVIFKPDRVPSAWKPIKQKTSDGKPIYIPLGQTEEAKSLRKIMDRIPTCPIGRLSMSLVGEDMIVTDEVHPNGRGQLVLECGVETFSGVDVVAVPIAMGGRVVTLRPDGGVYIPLSEYYRMKEEHGEKQKIAELVGERDRR